MPHNADTFIILSPGFAAIEADSTCLPAQQDFVRNLHKQYPNINIVVVAFQYPFVSEAYWWNDVRVISLNGRNRGRMNRLLTWLRVWKKLNMLRKKTRVIGIFSFWCTECALLGTYFGRLYGIRHLTWILGQDAKKANRRFVKIINPQAGDLVAMSDFLAQQFLQNHGILPVHVVPNGMLANVLPSTVANRNIDIIGVGSLIGLKQYDLFIDLIHQLKLAGFKVSARLYGKGPEKDHLLARIALWELQDDIVLAGEQNHDEIMEAMRASRILLHPSSYEGFSSVCLEALSAGVHVISFCKPMKTDILHWHVAANKEEMFNLLQQILADHHTDHSAIIPYAMEDSVRSIMGLFAGDKMIT